MHEFQLHFVWNGQFFDDVVRAPSAIAAIAVLKARYPGCHSVQITQID